MVKTAFPNFTYQMQLASGQVEEKVKTKEEIKQFLSAVYGGRGPNYEVGFVAEKGVLFENIPVLEPTRLLSEEELEYYAESFSRNGLRGPLNWYRTRELNFKDEKVLAEVKDLKIKVPVLLVQAKYDGALPPGMAKGMEKSFSDLKIREVDASHWVLWQRPEECNAIIKEFFEKLLGEEEKSML